MRDPARIDRILRLVRHCWQAYPNQQLLQLLFRVSEQNAEDTDRRFYEDNELEADLLLEVAQIRELRKGKKR